MTGSVCSIQTQTEIPPIVEAVCDFSDDETCAEAPQGLAARCGAPSSLAAGPPPVAPMGDLGEMTRQAFAADRVQSAKGRPPGGCPKALDRNGSVVLRRPGHLPVCDGTGLKRPPLAGNAATGVRPLGAALPTGAGAMAKPAVGP
jgi:hypothetical protein